MSDSDTNAQALIKKLQHELAEARHDGIFFKSLMEQLPDLVWLKDIDGVYLACNEQFEKFFGASEEQIKGKTDYDFVDAEIADFFREHDLLAMQLGHPSINEEWITFASDGHRSLVETTKTPLKDADGKVIGVLGTAHDITERKKNEELLQDNAQRYEAILAASVDGFWGVDKQGILRDVNPAYCHYSGYSRDELIGMHVSQLDVIDDPEIVRQRVEKVAISGGQIFESKHRRKDGSIWPVEVSINYSSVEGGRYFSFIRDITLRRQAEIFTDLHQELAERLYNSNANELMTTALDCAEKVTDSEIGFFHFVEEDEETVSLQVWSTRTLHEMCFAKGEGMHYPVSQAGVWVDCVHQKQAVIHNDYPSLPHKKGLPHGHAPLLRELTFPVMRDHKVVAIMGIGNKATYYTDADLRLVSHIAEMAYDFVERKLSQDKIHFMAYNDLLTGLPNRELFADRLQQAIYHSRRTNKLLGVCYLDLDGFKPVNDQYGHDVGDKLLIEFARRLKDEMREIDTIARLGGDEFVLLLNEINSINQGDEILQRLLDSIAEPFDIRDNRIYVSASIGVSYYPHDNVEADALLRHADQAMYQAKNSGKNTFHLYDPLVQFKDREVYELLRDLDNAIQESQLQLYYQPRINLSTGEVSGVEALIRWLHPVKGLLMPDSFLPMTKDSSQEILLDDWVIRQAIDQHMQWREQGLYLSISINITPRHIQQKIFPQKLRNLLADYPDDLPAYLELEILESGAIENIDRVVSVMQECLQTGVKFALDDFGTGYSSLTHFHRLPIDVLKIDRNFICDMLDNEQDLSIVQGVLQLAKHLNMPVVAEGVETAELGLILLQMGCEYAQGYGIARPLPAREFLHWLNKQDAHSVWRQLNDSRFKLTDDYALNVAIFSHQHWLDLVCQYIKTSGQSPKPDTDGRTCQFAHWYHGLGQARYANRPGYAFIMGLHNRTHDIAARMIAAVDAGKQASALVDCTEIVEIAEALTEKLIGLVE